MEGRPRRSFTEDYKRQCVELVVFEQSFDHLDCDNRTRLDPQSDIASIRMEQRAA
jgi:hypothetical protein